VRKTPASAAEKVAIAEKPVLVQKLFAKQNQASLPVQSSVLWKRPALPFAGAPCLLKACFWSMSYRAPKLEGQLWDDSASSIPHAQTAGIGASRPLPCVPAKVP
jgi:hypothetical protein